MRSEELKLSLTILLCKQWYSPDSWNVLFPSAGENNPFLRSWWDDEEIMMSLTWKSSSHGGWWWCSVARTQVFRKTRVTISQNIHWDLQMFRHFLLIDLFHLDKNNNDFLSNSICIFNRNPGKSNHIFTRYSLLESFHPFLPGCLSDVFSGWFSPFLAHFCCNSDWN